MKTMNYIGLNVHEKTISYCVKDMSDRMQQEGKIGATRRELHCWMRTLPQPWTVAIETDKRSLTAAMPEMLSKLHRQPA